MNKPRHSSSVPCCIGVVHTTPLVEIFSLYVDKFDVDGDERRGDVYGTLEAVDMNGSIEFYNRKRGSSENVGVNHSISLIGPLCSITAILGFVVNIDLHLRKDEDEGTMNGGEHSKDVEIGKWQLSWDMLKPAVCYITRGKYLAEVSNRVEMLSIDDICKTEEVKFNKALKATFKGQDGCQATMYYAILNFAVQASLLVDLIHTDYDYVGPDDILPPEYDVFGSIFARYDNFEHGNLQEYCKATILNTEESGSIKGIIRRKLKLSRWVMSVPGYSTLKVEIDLWCKDENNSRLKIAKQVVDFPPEGRMSREKIYGDGGFGIKFTVFWYSDSLETWD